MFVPSRVEIAHIRSQPEQKAELLDPEIGVQQRLLASLGVGRLDQSLQYIQSGRLHPVTEQELLAPRELLDRRHQPDDEPVHRLQRRSVRRALLARSSLSSKPANSPVKWTGAPPQTPGG
jgi:hypothetical protein